MKKKNLSSRGGCRGRRLKIEIEKSEDPLRDERSLIQKGTVVGAGPEATCKVGDVIIFNAWGCDKITLHEKDQYFILDTDEFVCEIVTK